MNNKRRSTAGRDNVGQVRQFLDHDDLVVERRLEKSRNGVGYQNGNHNRQRGSPNGGLKKLMEKRREI
jgi:hypothetical protein